MTAQVRGWGGGVKCCRVARLLGGVVGASTEVCGLGSVCVCVSPKTVEPGPSV